MNDRDHFAAAALSGLLASTGKYANGEPRDYAATAYQFADAMLRERERTDHDAAPAATAPTDAIPLRSAQSVTAGMGTGDQTAPPCVETDGSSSAIAQPPASSDGSDEGQPLDGPRPDTQGEATGGRGRNTSAANGDTSAKPVAESQDQRHEPVAWAVRRQDGSFYDVYLGDHKFDTSLMEREWGKVTLIPLYRTPQTCPYVVGRTTQYCSLTPLTLTDEEREAIEMACKGERWFPNDQHRIDTLRALLDRLK